MSRRPDTLRLSRHQLQLVQQYVQQPTRCPQEIKRGKVLLYWNDGLTGAETAAQLAIPEGRVYALRRAFKRTGLQHYLNSPVRGGAPTKLTPQVRKKLAQLATQSPTNTWSLRKVASYLMAQGVVSSISTVTVAKGLSLLKVSS